MAANILDLPQEVLAVILREVIQRSPSSARNFITCCRPLWFSETLSSHVSKLDICIEDGGAGERFDTMRSRVLSFPAHAYPQTLVIRNASSRNLSGADVVYLFMHPDVAERLVRLRTLLIMDGPARPPLMLSTIQCMLDKLPSLSTLCMPCVHGGGFRGLTSPFTALTRLELTFQDDLTSSSEPKFCSVIHESFPNLKVLTMVAACGPADDVPFPLSAPDLSTLAGLNYLEIKGYASVSVKGLNMLLTSPSRVRHLTIPYLRADGDTSQLSWSSCPLATLCVLLPANISSDKMTDRVLALLPQLPQLSHVWFDHVNMFPLNEELMLQRMAKLAPFACLDGHLVMYARTDHPNDLSPDVPGSVEGFVGMSKSELASRLGDCLHPLLGSRYRETVTKLDFDPSILTSASVRVLASIFPHVTTLMLSYCDTLEESPEMLVSMSLIVAVSVWPRLSSIELDTGPAFSIFSSEEVLLPLMGYMQASRRPLVLGMCESNRPDEREAWMKLRSRWLDWLRRSDEDSYVEVIPA